MHFTSFCVSYLKPPGNPHTRQMGLNKLSSVLCLLVVLLCLLPSSADKDKMPLTSHKQDADANTEAVYTSLYETSTAEFSNFKGNITGSKLPVYLLGGKLIRNGCGGFEMGSHSFSHVFDCYSKLHAWEFTEDGEVLVSAKFLTSNFYNKSLEIGDIYPSIYFGVESPRFTMQERTAAMKVWQLFLPQTH